MKKNLKILSTLIILLGLQQFNSVYSQIAFQKNYGALGNEEGNAIIAETNHTFTIAGYTASYGVGSEDALVYRVDAAGNVLSTSVYGATNQRDVARGIFKHSSGDYLVTGDRQHTGTSDDYFAQRLNNSLAQTQLYWYGDNAATYDEQSYAIQEVPFFNYYIMFGFTTQYGNGGQDAFFKIITSAGANNASRYFGGGGTDAAYDGFLSISAGIHIVGSTNSNGAGGLDGMIFKTSAIGPAYTVAWQRTIGSTGDEEFYAVKEVASGGIIVAGYTTGFSASGEDIFVCRIDASGSVTWARRIGGFGNERARGVWPTSDGGFILAGYTNSFGFGGDDGFLIKLASDGSTEWAKVYGGASNDRFNAMAIRPSSFGYAAVGYSESFTSGGRDVYLVVTDVNGHTECNQQDWSPTNVTVTPNVATSGLNVVTTGHSTFNQSFTPNTPAFPFNCLCTKQNLSANININGPAMVCANQSGVNYSFTSITGVPAYNWAATSATLNAPLNATSVTANFGTSQAQIIAQAVFGNCSDFDIDTIIVDIDPVAATISGTSPICLNQSSTLTANAVNPQSGVGGYAWSNLDNNQSTVVSPNSAGSYVYTVTITDGLGCTATASYTLNVNSLPNASATSNSPVCVGQTLNLNATGGVSYSWTGPNSFGDNTNNPSISNVNTAHAGTYTVTVTDANNCTNAASVNIVVNSLPNATSTNNSPICVGNTLSLNATGGNSYQWTGPNGFTDNIQNPSISNVTLVNAGTYTVTVTDANSCSTTTTTDVVINNNLSFTASYNSPVCVGGTLNLYSTPGASYQWVGPSSFTDNVENPSINNVTTAHAGTYTVTVTNAQGCTGSSSVTVVVNPAVTVNLGNDQTLCNSQTITLDAGNPGATYAWSDGSTNQTITVNSAGTYTVTVSNGCSTSSDDVVINYLSTPTASISPTGSIDICSGQSVTLTASGGDNYQWSDNSTSTSITVNNAGNYTVTVSNQCGSSTASVTVNISGTAPTVSISPNTNLILCPGQTIQLTASGANNYNWNTNETTNSITVSSGGTYTVVGTNNCGSSSAQVIVQQVPDPQVTYSGLDTVFICPGQSTTLQVSSNDNIAWNDGTASNNIVVSIPGTYYAVASNACGTDTVFIVVQTSQPQVSFTASPPNGPSPLEVATSNTSNNALTYQWDMGDGNSYQSNEPTHTYTSPGVYTIMLIGTDTYGCTDTAYFQITVDSCIATNTQFPNTFSPNADGINDLFEVQNNCIQNGKLVIYNRWGFEIFTTAGNIVQWNGTTNSSNEAVPGVYFYVLEYDDFNGTKHIHNGSIHLFR